MVAALPSLDNPFPGLRSFEAAETHLFFGREKQTDELMRRLQRSRLLAVVGTSGSGKSSLVRAGLIPSLESGYMASAGSRWRIVVLRPGADPIQSLARVLAPHYAVGETGFDAETRCVLVETTLRRSSLGLISAAREAGIAPKENLLVIVDQFEEIFRFRGSEVSDPNLHDNTAAFVKLLLEATAAREAGIFVVLTMRSDFLGDCAQFANLPEAINDGQYLIPRMTREERRRAIEGPVAVGGATMTVRLVQRLLNDLGDNPDQLPVLQHALMRTWDRWQSVGTPDQPLDIEHYEGVGGVAHALSIHAEEAFQSLSPDQQLIARDLFQCLCEKGVDGRETRRPTTLAEICGIVERSVSEVVAIIDAFRTQGRTFLMPPCQERLNQHSIIDISHESLIRLWQRLRTWVDEEARFAVTYKRLADAALRFRDGAVSLWRDPELRLASDWKEECQPNHAWGNRYHPGFQPAMDFLRQSEKAREAQKHRRQVVFIGMAIAAACFAVLAVAAFVMWQRAEIEKHKAVAAQKLATNNELLAKGHETRARAATLKAEQLQREAQSERDHAREAEARAKLSAAEEKAIAADRKRALDEKEVLQRSLLTRYLGREANALMANSNSLETATLLAAESLKREVSPEGRSALLEALMILPEVVLPKPGLTPEMFRMQVLKGIQASDGTVLGIKFTSDNKRLFVVRNGTESSKPEAELIDIASGNVERTFPLLDTPKRDSLKQWAMDATGQFLAVNEQSGMVRLLRAADGREVLRQQFDSPVLISLKTGGEYLAIGAQNGSLYTFNTKNGARTDEARVPCPIKSVELSPDGGSVAASCGDGSVRIVDLARKSQVALPGQNAEVKAVHFSPDGSGIVTGTADGTLTRFAVSGGEAVWKVKAGGGISALAFTPNGRFLATGNTDHSIRLIETASGREVRSIAFGDESPNVLEFSRDARLLAAGSNFRIARVFGTRSGAEFSRVGLFGGVSGLSYSPDSVYVAFAQSDRSVQVLRNRDGELASIQDDGGSLGLVHLSPTEKFLSVHRSADILEMRDYQRNRELWRTNVGSSFLWSAFSGDEKYLAVADEKARATVFELATGHQLNQLQELVNTSNSSVQALPALNGDGSYVATGNGDRHAQVFEVKTQREVFRAGYGGPVTAVALDKEGRFLAVAADRVRVYDLSSKRQVRRFDTGNTATMSIAGQNRPVAVRVQTGVALSPDGRMLAVGLDDNTVRLFSVATGEELLRIHHQGRINGMCFSPDGKRLIVTENLSRLIVHRLDVDELVQEACSRLTRNLSFAEWSLYFRDQPYRKTCPTLP